MDQYDWHSGSPGGLLCNTLISYAGLSGIADRPAEIEIEDGSGNLAAETTSPMTKARSNPPAAITYPSGPYASATPAKTFIYDSATVDGQAMANAVGRLAEAYTGASGAKITDEGFGYDPMGRPAELFESAPGSGGYYESQESYWQDGQRDTLTLPGVPVITYNPNSLGEVVSVDAASGQNPASSLA